MNLLLLGKGVLAAVFVMAGAAKLFDGPGMRRSLLAFGVPQAWTALLARLLPLFELASGVALLIPGATAVWGAAAALALLATFTSAIGVNIALGRRPACRCFGQLHSSPVGATTLLRNGLLALLAALIVWRQAPVVSSLGGLGAIPGVNLGAMVGALTVVTTAQACLGVIVVYVLLRQNGRLLRRVDALEAATGLSSTGVTAPGLPVGSPAPDFSARDLNGELVSSRTMLFSEVPSVLIFTEEGCAACDAMLPDVARWQQASTGNVTLSLIGSGSVASYRDKAAAHNLQHLLLPDTRDVAESYQVYQVPGAVLVRDGRIASAVAIGGAHIAQLVHAARSPVALKSGDLLPSLELQTLTGETVNLARRERATVLVFWDPSCGFCRAMLEDVRALERAQTRDDPELILVASGSIDANRQQRLNTTILLDPGFRVGPRFGISGTPSAVLVDAAARVASEVAVGPANVLRLAAVPTSEAVTA